MPFLYDRGGYIMKIILIDDEILALAYLEQQFKRIPDVNIIGKFTDPQEGKLYILHHDVDVVFLDIHLPGINGIELAEQILEKKPKLNVVFVSAHDYYAIKAFDLNALDYVLKPVSNDRLLNTIQRLKERIKMNDQSIPIAEPNLHIQLFGQLTIGFENHPSLPIRWRTSKVQELFLYLMQHRTQLVRKATLIELLWPTYEQSKAYSQLYTAIYHIRKTLEPYGNHFNISNTNDGYIFNMENVFVDVDKWEHELQTDMLVNRETFNKYEHLLTLYKGDYLEDYDYLWAENERHRLKVLWLQLSFKLAEWYTFSNLVQKAVTLYHSICQRQPEAEKAHFELMKIFAETNNHLAVHKQYKLLKNILQEELSVKPSSYITEWYLQWRQKKGPNKNALTSQTM